MNNNAVINQLKEDIENEEDIFVNFIACKSTSIALKVKEILLQNDYAPDNPNAPQQLFRKLRTCPECGLMKFKSDFAWTNDRYSIPYKRVCPQCYEKVQNQISKWEHDPSTGEILEEEGEGE